MKLSKLVSIFAFVLVSGISAVAAPGNISVGTVEGIVTVTAADGTQTRLVAGDVLRQNTRIATDKDSSAKVVLANGTEILLKPNTILDLSQFEQNNPSAVEGLDYSSFTSEPEATGGSMTTVRILKGTALFDVAKLLTGSSLTVKTHAGDVAVKGTTFYVSVSGTAVTAGCIDGAISVRPNGRAALMLTSGKSATISSSGAVSFERASSSLTAEASEAFKAVEDDRISSFGGSGSFDVTMPPAAVDGPNADRIPVNSASSL